MKRFIALLLTVVLLLCSCARKETRQRYETIWVGLFDTYIRLVGYAGSQSEFDAAAAQVHDLLVELDSLFDPYEAHEGTAGVWAVNHAGGQPVEADGRLVSLLMDTLSRQQELSRSVNVAMGSVLSLWHEARKAGGPLPDPDALYDAALHMDPARIRVDGERNTIELTDPALQLDLGAVAKGFAIGEAAKLLDKLMPSYLLDGGGNIAVGEAPADGRDAWVIGIRDPQSDDDTAILTTVKLIHTAAVTSGGYQRWFEVDGKRYHHLIDPETLYPAESCLQATVLCADSGLADFLSTAAFILPPDEARALIDSLAGVEALWVLPDGSTLQTDGFKG